MKLSRILLVLAVLLLSLLATASAALAENGPIVENRTTIRR